jgi:hypothetical protein
VSPACSRCDLTSLLCVVVDTDRGVAQAWLFGRPQAVTPALLPFLMHGGAVSSALTGAAAQDTVTPIYR